MINFIRMWFMLKCGFNSALPQYWHSWGGRQVGKRNDPNSVIHFLPNPLQAYFFHNFMYLPVLLGWTFCSFCSKSVTCFLSISSNLFAPPFWLDLVFLFGAIWQMSSGQSFICLSAQPKLQTATQIWRNIKLKTWWKFLDKSVVICAFIRVSVFIVLIVRIWYNAWLGGANCWWPGTIIYIYTHTAASSRHSLYTG